MYVYVCVSYERERKRNDMRESVYVCMSASKRDRMMNERMNERGTNDGGIRTYVRARASVFCMREREKERDRNQ